MRSWSLLILMFVVAQVSSLAALDAPPFETIRWGAPNSSSLAPAVMDESIVCWCWNQDMVTLPTLTAVELSTGRNLWSKQIEGFLPSDLRLEDGWVHFKTLSRESDSRYRLSGFSLVNARTGDETKIPWNPNHTLRMHRSHVHGNYCLTPQSSLIRCSDGELIGDLGTGEHTSVVLQDEHLFVKTSFIDESDSFSQKKQILRRMVFSTLEVEREMELPLEAFGEIVAAKGDVVILIKNSPEFLTQLVCFDLEKQQERWRVSLPKSVAPFPAAWDEDSNLILYTGVQFMIRPVKIYVDSGVLLPDGDWKDPRLLLSWHHDTGQYPDFVAANPKFLIGRWRSLELACLDAQTGQLIWNHLNSDNAVGRLFTENSRLGDYIVAALPDGFEIITVAAGERRFISAASVGLTPVPRRRPRADENDLGIQAAGLVGSPKRDRMTDWMLVVSPLLPLVVWITWNLSRRPATKNRGSLV